MGNNCQKHIDQKIILPEPEPERFGKFYVITFIETISEIAKINIQKVMQDMNIDTLHILEIFPVRSVPPLCDF